jgi:hypothetical protein
MRIWDFNLKTDQFERLSTQRVAHVPMKGVWAGG